MDVQALRREYLLRAMIQTHMYLEILNGNNLDLTCTGHRINNYRK